MKLLITFISIFFISLIGICTIQAQCLKSDSLELVKLYEATNGSRWKYQWNLSEPVSTWIGVRLTNDGCHVKDIILPHNKLYGSIQNLNLNLPKLKELDLSYNHLISTIPNFDLPKLKKLNLKENIFIRGSIPNFDKLPSLEELDMEGNSLSGNIPNFDLPKLKKLNLRENRLSGNISNFDKLPSLEELNLFDNNLSGSIPNFDKLTSLEELDLSYNRLINTIPNFDLPNLEKLNLRGNRLSESIPNFDKLPSLEELDLNDNQLIGLIPNFDNLPNLRKLDLAGVSYYNYAQIPMCVFLNVCQPTNRLSGTIPNFDNLPKLEDLDLDNNKLSGTIPNFDNLPKLEDLDLDNNKLSGTIPNFDNLPKLEDLYLTRNQLSGIIPNFDKLPSLEELDLAHNQLSGRVPNFNNLSNLSFLDLESNSFTFDGIEENLNISKIRYKNQSNIPIYKDAKKDLYVKAGGNIDKNTYYWYKNDVVYDTIVGDSLFTPTEPGVYHCKVINSAITVYPNYCNFPDCIIISEFYELDDHKYLVLYSKKISISQTDLNHHYYTREELENKQKSDMVLFPNPAHKRVSINLKDVHGKQMNIRILDRLGNVRLTRSIKPTGRNIQFNIESLSKGNYYVQVQVKEKLVDTKTLIISD